MTNEILLSAQLPVLALRGLVVFPGMLAHFDVGREKSVLALDEAMSHGQEIFLVTQKDISVDDPALDGLYDVGCICHIRQMLKLPGDTVRILVEGRQRGHIVALQRSEPFLYGRVESMESLPARDTPRVEAMLRSLLSMFDEYTELGAKLGPEQMLRLVTNTDPGFAADFIAQNIAAPYAAKQKALQELNVQRRLELVTRMLARELEVLRIEHDLQEKVQAAVGQSQREYYLREQMKVLRSELGEDDEEGEAESYISRIRALKLEPETEQKLLKEVSRLQKQPSGSSEAAVIRSYLDVCLELPWNTRTKERLDVKAARRILDADHYGLEKVKKRVLESLAVRQLAPEQHGQILCLVGPPGVGKTSVAMSIARATGRNLARVALGGVHDEADIRGHRKTYIGAMPGRVISAIRQAGSKNALLLFDEIDKLGGDYRGDPSSALLEVLDSAQNSTFRDHYLEIPFDLSEVFFITTANTTDTIPRALLDRMEVIELPSYTDEEKVVIGKKYLLPRQMEKAGIPKGALRVSDTALREMIDGYTRESGVRSLEREMGTLCRRAALQLVENPQTKRISVSGSNLEAFLGVRKFHPDRLSTERVGIVTGLAWTAVGGETLEVECTVMDGSGKLICTGNLGDVMKESVQLAQSYIRTRARRFHIPEDFYKTKDIHVHFPAGAVPKDGPSAGVTITTAMVSALSGAVVRRELAMTGEISICGRVLPIGGLREKTMAALRHGIKTVIIPADNEPDLEEIDPLVRKALNFVSVSQVDAVIEYALDFSACTGLEAQARQESVPAEDRKEDKAAALPLSPTQAPVHRKRLEQ